MERDGDDPGRENPLEFSGNPPGSRMGHRECRGEGIPSDPAGNSRGIPEPSPDSSLGIGTRKFSGKKKQQEKAANSPGMQRALSWGRNSRGIPEPPLGSSGETGIGKREFFGNKRVRSHRKSGEKAANSRECCEGVKPGPQGELRWAGPGAPLFSKGSFSMEAAAEAGPGPPLPCAIKSPQLRAPGPEDAHVSRDKNLSKNRDKTPQKRDKTSEKRDKTSKKKTKAGTDLDKKRDSPLKKRGKRKPPESGVKAG